MSYGSTRQFSFVSSFLHLPYNSTQWGLEPGPRSWCQDLRVGGRAEGMEPGPGGWSQGPGDEARDRGLEPWPGDWSQDRGVGARAQGLEPGARARGNGETKKIALYGIIGHRPLRGRCPKVKKGNKGRKYEYMVFYRISGAGKNGDFLI